MTTYNVELATGQVALYERSGLVGWGITLVTGGNKSHAGLIIVDGGRHYVLDARKPYCDVRPISADVRHGARIKIARLPYGCEWDAAGLADFAYQIEGYAPYATRKMLRNAWTETFGVGSLPDPEGIPSRFMCSELVSCLCRLFASVDPCPTRPDRYTTPDDLDRKSSLVTVTDRLTLQEAAP